MKCHTPPQFGCAGCIDHRDDRGPDKPDLVYALVTAFGGTEAGARKKLARLRGLGYDVIDLDRLRNANGRPLGLETR